MTCTRVGDAVICHEAMREVSRKPDGARYCFRCRKIQAFEFVITAPTDLMSWYGPNANIECGKCHLTDGDLFPGRIREWE